MFNSFKTILKNDEDNPNKFFIYAPFPNSVPKHITGLIPNELNRLNESNNYKRGFGCFIIKHRSEKVALYISDCDPHSQHSGIQASQELFREDLAKFTSNEYRKRTHHSSQMPPLRWKNAARLSIHSIRKATGHENVSYVVAFLLSFNLLPWTNLKYHWSIGNRRNWTFKLLWNFLS